MKSGILILKDAKGDQHVKTAKGDFVNIGPQQSDILGLRQAVRDLYDADGVVNKALTAITSVIFCTGRPMKRKRFDPLASAKRKALEIASTKIKKTLDKEIPADKD